MKRERRERENERNLADQLLNWCDLPAVDIDTVSSKGHF